jgi:hypothetical protein
MTESARGSASTGGLIEDAVRLIVESFTEVVPTEAQLHLLNAQRELLLALAITIDHNASRSLSNPRGARKSTPKGRPKPSRVTID